MFDQIHMRFDYMMMNTNTTTKNHACNNLIHVGTCLFFSSVIGLILAGCSSNGDGVPTNAHLSTSTSMHATLNPITDSGETWQARQEDSLASPPTNTTAGLTSALSDDFSQEPPSLPSGDDTIDAIPPTDMGVAVQVTWNPSTDSTSTRYNVYYGKQQSGELGSCSYEQSQPVDAPPAMITGLEPNTPYYFAISAFNEAESPCSIEFMLVTPPANS